MKHITVLGLFALTANAAVTRRQHESGGKAGGMPDILAIASLLPKGFDFSKLSMQMPKGGLAAMLKPEVRKAYKVEEIQPKRNPQATRVRITHGPYKVKPANAKDSVGNAFSMDPAGTGYNNLADSDFPRDVMILDSWSGLVNETFQKAMVEDGIYNHHIVFYDMSKKAAEPWIACNGRAVPEIPMSVFMGAGSEDIDAEQSTATTNSEVKAGYYIGKNDVITFGMDVVNYQDRERTLYIVSEMEYLPGKPEGYVHAQSRIVPMGVCDGGLGLLAAVNVRPPVGEKKFVLEGKKDIEIIQDGHLTYTGKWKLPRQVTLLNCIAGHLHDGGLKMVVTINGKSACESKIVYGGQGHEQIQPNGEIWKTIGKTIICGDPIRVSKGDKLQLHAHFDFNEHPPRHSAHGEEAEGMALLATKFVPLVA